ncbi:MAG: PASTA domain-containing protein [Muribaculaceae bacterium]
MWNKIKAFNDNYPVIATLIYIVLVSIVLVWLGGLFVDLWTRHNSDATVPEIKNMTYAQAEAVLEENGLSIEISDSIYDKNIAPGTIVESWPKAGSVVKRGRNIYVTVTAFSPRHVTITMPITGVSSRQAVSYLTALGVSGIRFINAPSQYPDLVESAHADGRPIGVGSVISVDATVTLEVGVAIEEPVDSIGTAEEAVIEDLQNMSSYSDL